MPGRTSLVHILTHAHSNADVAFHAVMLQAARQADGRTLQKAGERPPVVETSRILWDRIVSKSAIFPARSPKSRPKRQAQPTGHPA